MKLHPIGIMMAIAALVGAGTPARAATDPLRFPKDKFKLETVVVKSASGERRVVYRLYEHLPYVARPVDKDYQSLDVKVPVAIDGRPVDASMSPILFVIGVGGYMSAPNVREGKAVMGPPPGGPPANAGVGPPGGLAGPSGMPPRPGGPPGGPTGAAETAGLAAGWVIVIPGVRGRDNQGKDGVYFGKAPAAIVDLKAAVRYIRHNRGVLPGNDEWIVSTGCSAGGALSTLLAASGNSTLYEPYLRQIGAAAAADNIFAAGCHSPVTDLEHADQIYEFEFGASKTTGSQAVDAKVSAELQALYRDYQASLRLEGREGFGTLTADNIGAYAVRYYLAPAAGQFLLGLGEEQRTDYLAKNPWLKWDGQHASFTLAEFAAQHIKRFKLAPAFDDFGLKAPETNLFGNASTDSAHFTNYSLRHTSGNAGASVDVQLQQVVNLMNPMYFLRQRNPGAAQHWWIRHGAIETDASAIGSINLTTALENMGRKVNAAIYWDAGHCEDLDPQGFIDWVGRITRYRLAH